MSSLTKYHYIKPSIETHHIDNEISVFMASENTPPGGGGTGPFATTKSASTADPLSSFDTTSADNTFTSDNAFE